MDLITKRLQPVVQEQVRADALPFSHPINAFAEMVKNLTQHYLGVWWACERTFPQFNVAYLPGEQAENGKRLDRMVSGLLAELKHIPQAAAERQAWQERLRLGMVDFARSALRLEQRQLDFIESSGMLAANLEFARMARRFDPRISGEDIYQAGRNVMTANFIQLLLNRPVEVTPSIFAYSMLYPYTDNYLDDPAVSRATKAAFNRRFQLRLQGEKVLPENPQEAVISQLVEMIEGQWERTRYPQVYESLLAIHAAQGRSLGLVAPGASPFELDVLGVSFEKGGTSVLADGYLAAGELTFEQARVLFGYGSFTQLMDDLEDIPQDQQENSASVFSLTAGRWPLDGLTNHFFHFGRAVFNDLDAFQSRAAPDLEGLIARSIDPVLVDTVSRAWKYYSPAYLREMERHFSFRFETLRKAREKLARQKVDVGKLVDLLVQ